MWKVPDVKLLCMLQILGALQKQIKLYTVRSQSACWSFGERNRSYLTQTNEERGYPNTGWGNSFACSQRIS